MLSSRLCVCNEINLKKLFHKNYGSGIDLSLCYTPRPVGFSCF